MTHFYQVAKVEDPSLSIFNFEDICIKKQSCFGDYIQNVQNNFNPNNNCGVAFNIPTIYNRILKLEEMNKNECFNNN